MAGTRLECSALQEQAPASDTSARPLPHELWEALVDALAAALVADCQEDTATTVESPRGSNRGSTEAHHEPQVTGGSDDCPDPFVSDSPRVR